MTDGFNCWTYVIWYDDSHFEVQLYTVQLYIKQHTNSKSDIKQNIYLYTFYKLIMY